MNNEPARLFRPAALNSYSRRTESGVLPMLVMPRVFLIFWVLLGILLAGIVMATVIEVPIFVKGEVVTPRGGGGSPTSEHARLLAVLPSATPASLSAGQRVLLHQASSTKIGRGHVAEVVPDLLSREEVGRRFNIVPPVHDHSTHTFAVVIVEVEEAPESEPESEQVKKFSEVRIEVGSTRPLSLLLGR